MRQLLIAIMIMLGLPCVAQHSLYNLKFKLSKKHFVDTIAIDFQYGRITLPVSFNGKTYRFLLDTGASQTTIYKDTPIEGAKTIGFTVSYDAFNRPDTVDKVLLPPMQIGELVLTKCQGVVRHRLNTNDHFDGIIGFDLICKGLSMKIDVRERILVLTDIKSFFNREPGINIAYQLERFVPYIWVSPFTDYRELALVDTGSSQLYMMSKINFDRALEQHGDNLEQLVVGRTTGSRSRSFSGTEPMGEVVKLKLDRLLIGRYLLEQVPTETTGLNSHIGTGLLEYGSVVFLPRHRIMRFLPYPTDGESQQAKP
ncbi:MAG: clan AA aspartic protease [Prevotella sp.]|nr:clan AA aspartic protease [Prevotella sp.]